MISEWGVTPLLHLRRRGGPGVPSQTEIREGTPFSKTMGVTPHSEIIVRDELPTYYLD